MHKRRVCACRTDRLAGPARYKSARETRKCLGIGLKLDFLASRFARALVYRVGYANLPVLQARSLKSLLCWEWLDNTTKFHDQLFEGNGIFYSLKVSRLLLPLSPLFV